MRKIFIEALDVSRMGTAALYAAMESASEETNSDEDEGVSVEEQ